VHPASSKSVSSDVVSEWFTVRLRRRRSLFGSNEPLCPLTLDLVASEIAARERERGE
jgi:hypothetical protein